MNNRENMDNNSCKGKKNIPLEGEPDNKKGNKTKDGDNFPTGGGGMRFPLPPLHRKMQEDRYNRSLSKEVLTNEMVSKYQCTKTPTDAELGQCVVVNAHLSELDPRICSEDCLTTYPDFWRAVFKKIGNSTAGGNLSKSPAPSYYNECAGEQPTGDMSNHVLCAYPRCDIRGERYDDSKAKRALEMSRYSSKKPKPQPSMKSDTLGGKKKPEHGTGSRERVSVKTTPAQEQQEQTRNMENDAPPTPTKPLPENTETALEPPKNAARKPKPPAQPNTTNTQMQNRVCYCQSSVNAPPCGSTSMCPNQPKSPVSASSNGLFKANSPQEPHGNERVPAGAGAAPPAPPSAPEAPNNQQNVIVEDVDNGEGGGNPSQLPPPDQPPITSVDSQPERTSPPDNANIAKSQSVQHAGSGSPQAPKRAEDSAPSEAALDQQIFLRRMDPILLYFELSILRNLDEYPMSAQQDRMCREALLREVQPVVDTLFSRHGKGAVLDEMTHLIKAQQNVLAMVTNDSSAGDYLNAQSFYNKDLPNVTLCGIVNGEDHLQLVGATYHRNHVNDIVKCLNEVLQNPVIERCKFMCDDSRYGGFLTFSPRFVGSGVRVRCIMRLKMCFNLPDFEEQYLSKWNLFAILQEEDDDIYLLQNRNGSESASSVSAMKSFCQRVKDLVALEEDLCQNNPHVKETDSMATEKLKSLAKKLMDDNHLTYAKKHFLAGFVARFGRTRTAYNGDLAHCIRMNAHHPDALFPRACDPECYTTFNNYFDRILLDCNDVKNWSYTHRPDVDVVDEFTHDKITSVRVRFVRNLDGYPFNMLTSLEMKRDIEARLVSAAGRSAPQGYSGKYYPLSTPEGQEAWKRASAMGLAPALEDRLKKASGVYRHWPEHRGLYLLGKSDELDLNNYFTFKNDMPKLAMVFNEEDHLKIVCLAVRDTSFIRTFRTAYSTLVAMQNALGGVKAFAQNSQLGFLSPRPHEVGSGMRISCHIKCTKLTKDLKHLDDLCKDMHIQYRGTSGDGTEIVDDVVEISLKRKMAAHEYLQLDEFFLGLKKILDEDESVKDKKNKRINPDTQPQQQQPPPPVETSPGDTEEKSQTKKPPAKKKTKQKEAAPEEQPIGEQATTNALRDTTPHEEPEESSPGQDGNVSAQPMAHHTNEHPPKEADKHNTLEADRKPQSQKPCTASEGKTVTKTGEDNGGGGKMANKIRSQPNKSAHPEEPTKKAVTPDKEEKKPEASGKPSGAGEMHGNSEPKEHSNPAPQNQKSECGMTKTKEDKNAEPKRKVFC